MRPSAVFITTTQDCRCKSFQSLERNSLLLPKFIVCWVCSVLWLQHFSFEFIFVYGLSRSLVLFFVCVCVCVCVCLRLSVEERPVPTFL